MSVPFVNALARQCVRDAATAVPAQLVRQRLLADLFNTWHLKAVELVKGWNRPQPGELYGRKISDGGKVSVSASTYKSFDDGWTNDFDKVVEQALAAGDLKAGDILFDARERGRP